jgi:DNA-binding NtrC family response regulator
VSLNPLHRQILILADEPPIRNLQHLLKRLELENPTDGSDGVASAMQDRKKFDSVILDLRSQGGGAAGEIHGIQKIKASRMGRTMVVTAEISGPKTLSLMEQYLTDGLQCPLLWLVSHRY